MSDSKGLPVALPDGKAFAFTLFDDTDVSTLEGVRPVYDFLYERGFLTTKTVWCFDHRGKSAFAGSHTLEHPEYRTYVQELQRRGFEIAFHGASMESSDRQRTRRALDDFRGLFGTDPVCYAAHAHNQENLYWGHARLRSRWAARCYRLLTRSQTPNAYTGHRPGSAYYWADIAATRLRYVRNFTFNGLDLSRLPAPVCYHDPKTPEIPAWFCTADADNVEAFNRLLAPAQQDRLAARGGVSIVSTHLGKGFAPGGRLHAETARLLDRLAGLGGWYVPVGRLLDHLCGDGVTQLTETARVRLEWRWLGALIFRRLFRSPRYAASETEFLRQGRT